MKLILTRILMVLAASIIALEARSQRDTRLDELKNEKDRNVLQKKLRQLENGGEDDLKLLMQYYSGNFKKRDSIQTLAIGKFPRGYIAQTSARMEINAQSDVLAKEEMVKAFKLKFPDTDHDNVNYAMAYAFAADKKPEKSIFYANQIKSREQRAFYSTVLADEILKYDPLSAEKLVLGELPRLKENLLNGSVNQGPLGNARQAYFTMANLYGRTLIANGKERDALPIVKEVYENSSQKDLRLISDYGYLLAFVGDYKSAFPLLDTVVKAGSGELRTKKMLAKAYTKLNEGRDGEKYVRSLSEMMSSKVNNEVEKMLIRQPAPNFEVTDANGNIVRLSDFRGKTIVLDFWATWCGPCKQSFPAMQLVVDKYKDDDKVKFLFIHTWERSKTPLKDATEYLKGANYRFDLYMDVSDPVTRTNKAVSLFNVRGIPAKFVIDGNGEIRFSVVGFPGGDDAAVAELSAMIDLAKSKTISKD